MNIKQEKPKNIKKLDIITILYSFMDVLFANSNILAKIRFKLAKTIPVNQTTGFFANLY